MEKTLDHLHYSSIRKGRTYVPSSTKIPGASLKVPFVAADAETPPLLTNLM
jgi:hypothetical protein